MQTKLFLTALSLLALTAIPLTVQAATITSCTLDKATYQQGQTGYITVVVYNDEDSKIRVTELTATIDYFYSDGTQYLQKFFTNATLPIEIAPGLSSTFYIPFSLPTNVAPGYTKPTVEARTEIWNSVADRWFTSDHPISQPKLYIESPYKQQYMEQKSVNDNLTATINLYIAATGILAVVAAFLGFIVFLRRAGRIPPQS